MDLAALKKKHRIIFCTEFPGKLIYWRALTLREFDIYTKIIELELVSPGKLEDKIFREVVLNLDIIDNMNNEPPGLISSIVGAVMHVSGCNLRQESDMERMNDDIISMRNGVHSSIMEKFIMLICKAFHTYTPEQLENLEYYELLRLAVMAEHILDLETPISVKPKKEERLTDKIFMDKQKGTQVDTGAPAAVDIRDILNERERIKNMRKEYTQAEQMRKIHR